MPNEQITFASPGTWVIFFEIFLICCSGYFAFVAWKSINAFVQYFRNRAKLENLSLPFSIGKITSYSMVFWSAFAIGSFWMSWAFLNDGFLAFDSADTTQDSIVLRYKILGSETRVRWEDISKSELIDRGTTTAILQVTGRDGQHWQSARSDIGTLDQALIFIRRHQSKNSE